MLKSFIMEIKGEKIEDGAVFAVRRKLEGFDEKDFLHACRQIEQLKEFVRQNVINHEELLELLLITTLAGGHILVEGTPGVGKSLTINTFTSAFELKTRHVHSRGDFIGTNFLLIDEIERSEMNFRRGLLSAMQERECLIDGKLFYLEQPFVVMATINPESYHGRSPLSKAELDRFMLHHIVGFPSPEEELQILDIWDNSFKRSLQPFINSTELLKMQRLIRHINISPEIKKLIVEITGSTRIPRKLKLPIKENFNGLSPRASIYLCLAAQARALIHQQKSVRKQDIAAVMPAVFRHRLSCPCPADVDESLSLIADFFSLADLYN
jgi:MoxR-like ATPase